MRLRITILFFTAFLLISCKGTTKDDSTTVTSKTISENLNPKTFSEKLQVEPDAQLIDVRTTEEFNSKHLDMATNIDINESGFDKKIATLDKTKPTFVYCLSGGRSSVAIDKMQKQGFTELYNMDGGMIKWDAQGLDGGKIGTKGLTKADFEKLIRSKKEVLFDFTAKWCAPCKKLKTSIEKLKSELKDDEKIITIDVDQNEELAKELKIERLPTLIFYEDNKLVWRNIGCISVEELKDKI